MKNCLNFLHVFSYDKVRKGHMHLSHFYNIGKSVNQLAFITGVLLHKS